MAVRVRALVLAVLVAASVAVLAVPALAQADEQVRGALRDVEREPVAGVTIEVADPDGNVIGTVETDAEGTWEVDLPDSGEYVITLDEGSLPEGMSLSDNVDNPNTVGVRPGQSRTVIFQIGEAASVAEFFGPLAQRTLVGIRFGLIIAITAIGLSLIFGTTGLVNFAHGELVTFGAIVAWFLSHPSHFGLQLLLAVALATLISAAFGGGVELAIFRPLRRRRTGLVQMLVISIGLALFLRFSMQVWFGGGSQPFATRGTQAPIRLGPIRLTPRDIIIMVIATVVLVAVATALQKTRMGKAMRAVADNRDLASSSGINVPRVILFVWVVGGGLAGFGGILYGLDQNVSYLMGFRLLLLMFAGIILGGLGTAYGAMFGSLVIGLVTELSTLWFPSELKFVWALAVLILILLVRPQGILGRAERIG